MSVYISIAVCLAPFVLTFILYEVFSKIRISTLLISSVVGLAAVLPISFIQFLLVYYFPSLSESGTNLLSVFLKTFLFNGLLEEGIKALFLIFIPRKKSTFAHFFMACLLMGLALGCFESVVYFLRHLESSNANNGTLLYHLIFVRMFSSVLIHTFCAGLCGLFIWSVKEKQPDMVSLLIAVLSHGLFDFFVSFSTWIQWFSVAAILLAIIECRIHYEKNKPLTEYKKSPLPQEGNADITVESALKDAPVHK